jgi:hypothetical protein
LSNPSPRSEALDCPIHANVAVLPVFLTHSSSTQWRKSWWGGRATALPQTSQLCKEVTCKSEMGMWMTPLFLSGGLKWHFVHYKSWCFLMKYMHCFITSFKTRHFSYNNCISVTYSNEPSFLLRLIMPFVRLIYICVLFCIQIAGKMSGRICRNNNTRLYIRFAIRIMINNVHLRIQYYIIEKIL